MQTFLKVLEVKSGNGKTSGRAYQDITLKQFSMLGNQEVVSRLIRDRRVWDEGHTQDGKVIAADAYFNTLTKGQIVEGRIETFDTTTYVVNERPVNKITCVIFSDEGNGINYVNNQLKLQGACVVDQYGQATKPAQVNSNLSTAPANVVGVAADETDNF